MANHTPGPWAVHPQRAFIVPASHSSRPIGGDVNNAKDLATYAQEIALLHHPDRHRGEGETRANARLIAAAPELLEALEDMKKWVAAFAYGQGSNVHAEVMKSQRMQKAMSAIAKATGETE